jgi:deazaflavin-dependent oxidoreductase (nitroreductase family)
MPLPRRIAELNRSYTNRLTGRFAGRVPPFALVEHRGRRSGKAYRTPVMVFAMDGGYAIALTYGPGTDWVRNVEAAGGCTIVLRGRSIALANPRVEHGRGARARFPLLVRLALRLIGVADVLVLSPNTERPPG